MIAVQAMFNKAEYRTHLDFLIQWLHQPDGGPRLLVVDDFDYVSHHAYILDTIKQAKLSLNR